MPKPKIIYTVNTEKVKFIPDKLEEDYPAILCEVNGEFKLVYSEATVAQMLGYCKKNLYRLRVRGYLPKSPLRIDPCQMAVYTKNQVDVARKELKIVHPGFPREKAPLVFKAIQDQWQALGIYEWNLKRSQGEIQWLKKKKQSVKMQF